MRQQPLQVLRVRQVHDHGADGQLVLRVHLRHHAVRAQLFQQLQQAFAVLHVAAGGAQVNLQLRQQAIEPQLHRHAQAAFLLALQKLAPQHGQQQRLLQRQALAAHQRVRPFVVVLGIARLPAGRHRHIGQAAQVVHAHLQVQRLQQPVDARRVAGDVAEQLRLAGLLQQAASQKLLQGAAQGLGGGGRGFWRGLGLRLWRWGVVLHRAGLQRSGPLVEEVGGGGHLLLNKELLTQYGRTLQVLFSIGRRWRGISDSYGQFNTRLLELLRGPRTVLRQRLDHSA